MKIALVSDVHANLPALEAVLDHAGQQGYDELWNLGDYVGYGPYPNQVVRVLRAHESRGIIGNYDRKVLQFKKKRKKWRESKAPLKFQAFTWADRNLSSKNRSYLQELPEKVRVRVNGHTFLLVHGSPESSEEPISTATPPERLAWLAAASAADIILSGHSHEPFFGHSDSCRFINPGSVGRPGDGDPRAAYALLDVSSAHLEIAFFRVIYDLQRAVKTIRKKGLPEAFARMLLEGKSLDQLDE